MLLVPRSSMASHYKHAQLACVFTSTQVFTPHGLMHERGWVCASCCPAATIIGRRHSEVFTQACRLRSGHCWKPVIRSDRCYA